MTMQEALDIEIADMPRCRALYARGLRPYHSDFPAFRVEGPPLEPIPRNRQN